MSALEVAAAGAFGAVFAWAIGLARSRWRAWREPSIHDRDTLPEIEPPDTVRSVISPAETPVGTRLIDAVEWAAPVHVECVTCTDRGVLVRYRPLANALLTSEDLAAMLGAARRVLGGKLAVELEPTVPHLVGDPRGLFGVETPRSPITPP